MMPQLYQTIEKAIADGIQPAEIHRLLVNNGWPPDLVKEAIDAWLGAHGRGQRKTSFNTWLKKYRSRALNSVIITTLIGVISSGIILLRPWPTKILVDSVFGNTPAPGPLKPYTHKPSLILITSLMTIIIFVVGAIVGILRDYVVLRLGFYLNREIKEESFRHILNLPLYHKERLPKGDYIYRQNVLTNSLSDLVLDSVSSIAQSVILIAGVLAIMVWFNLKLTIISVVLVPFLFILIRLVGPPLGKLARQITQMTSETSSLVSESIDNVETVQSFSLEEKQTVKANKYWWQTYILTRKAMVLGALFRSTDSLLIILGSSAVMYYGGIAALNHQMTLGQLLIFMTYMGYLLGPIENIAKQIAARNQKKIDVSRVYEILTDHEGIENQRDDHHIPRPRGMIEFQHVSYTYGGTLVLKDINLIIKPSEKVGIIGPSGGGKSTLLKLLPLYIEPTRGRILIDNFDIQTISLKELRRHISWISQNPQLFSGSILENLLDADISRPFPKQMVEKAVEAANVKEFTDRFPEGLETHTSEQGGSLSGGQRQRIAIARGLLKDAPIICMDEPTAALDSKSENHIRDSLGQIIHGKTVMMVTHRKALLSLMDTIYVVEEGTVTNIEDHGGLEKYLRKINDLEGGKQLDPEYLQAQQLEAEKQHRIAQLELTNARLIEELRGYYSEEQKLPATGTIDIDHKV